MKAYIGVKIVQAEPMGLLEFSRTHLRNITIPSGTPEEGYKVVYEDGYTYWSPKGTFERCYREITDAEKDLI